MYIWATLNVPWDIFHVRPDKNLGRHISLNIGTMATSNASKEKVHILFVCIHRCAKTSLRIEWKTNNNNCAHCFEGALDNVRRCATSSEAIQRWLPAWVIGFRLVKGSVTSEHNNSQRSNLYWLLSAASEGTLNSRLLFDASKRIANRLAASKCRPFCGYVH